MAKKGNEPPKFPEIGARLAQFIEQSSEPNARQFAIRAGLAPQLISNLCGGYSMPSGETLVALATTYPKFDAMWLLTGKGSMLRDGKVLAPPAEAAEPRPDFTTAAGTVEEAGAVLRLARSETENEQLRQRLEDAKAEITWLRGKSFPSSDAADSPLPDGPTPVLSVTARRRAGFQQQGVSLD